MSVGVVPHYRPCLLAWYLTIDHAFWSIVTAINILLVECRWKKAGYKSGATCTEVPLYQTCLMIRCHSQICLLVQFNFYQTCLLGSWIHVCKVLLYQASYLVCDVTNPSDIPTGRMPLPQGCKTCRVPSWTPSWIYHILNYVLIASLGCYKDKVFSSKISKIILHANSWSLPVSGTIFLYFCYKLPSWRPFCPYYSPTFYLVIS